MPEVSVIIPTYNCADFICDAIDSVLAQTYKDYEIIVVDGSTDNTKDVLKKYNGKIRYFYQESRGVSAARNKGIKEAKGKYITLLDADDIWLPDKLKLQMEAIKSNPEVAMVFTDCESFNEKGTVRESGTRTQEPPEKIDKGSFRGKVLQMQFNDGIELKGNFYEDLLQGNLMHTSSILLNKEYLNEVGQFDESLLVCEDYELWLRIALKFPLLYINKITAKYRIRDNGLSKDMAIRPYHYKKWDAFVLEKHLKISPSKYRRLIKERTLKLYTISSWGYLNNNDKIETKKICFRALKCGRANMKIFIYLFLTFLPLKLISYLRRKKYTYA